MLNVSDVKEETITEYLIWRWRELDKRFKYINITPFTRLDENKTTGADFELELWLVGRTFHARLVVQAKKLVKQFDSHVRHLNYPNATQLQLKTLLSYATSRNRWPVYIFYSTLTDDATTMCAMNNVADTAVFLADAYRIQEFADGKHGRKVSASDLINASNPFHCLFCCPVGGSQRYFRTYLKQATSFTEDSKSDRLPSYVSQLLDGAVADGRPEAIREIIFRNELFRFRAVGVYDMRDTGDQK